jgi:hypothetical protein
VPQLNCVHGIFIVWEDTKKVRKMFIHAWIKIPHQLSPSIIFAHTHSVRGNKLGVSCTRTASLPCVYNDFPLGKRYTVRSAHSRTRTCGSLGIKLYIGNNTYVRSSIRAVIDRMPSFDT